MEEEIKEIKLKEDIKLVSFETKGGIYVYDGLNLIGCLTVTRIVDQSKI